MITILRFPVYVQIETGSVDRAMVSKEAKKILYPILLEFLHRKAKYKRQYLDELSKSLGGTPVSVVYLADLEMIHKSVSNEESSSSSVI